MNYSVEMKCILSAAINLRNNVIFGESTFRLLIELQSVSSRPELCISTSRKMCILTKAAKESEINFSTKQIRRLRGENDDSYPLRGTLASWFTPGAIANGRNVVLEGMPFEVSASTGYEKTWEKLSWIQWLKPGRREKKLSLHEEQSWRVKGVVDKESYGNCRVKT